MRGLLFDIAALQVPERNAKLEVQGLYPGAMYGADFASFPASNMTTTAASFARRTSKPNGMRRGGQSGSCMDGARDARGI